MSLIFNLLFWAIWYLLYRGILLRSLRNENILGCLEMPYECKMLNIKWCVYMYKVTYLDTTFLIGGLFTLKKSIQDINFPTYIFHSLLCSLFSLVKEFVFNKISFDAGFTLWRSNRLSSDLFLVQIWCCCFCWNVSYRH